MITETKTISEGQRFTDIFDFIPENAIITKTLPGIGATYCEIVSKRHSIIVEPNVPVIVGKKEKHPDILGVIKGVTTQHIMDYLQGDAAYKKIIVTPESFDKVQRAFKKLGINYFEDYFLLIDECERLTQDKDYRDTIDAPLEDFWKFKKRSFISATPIINMIDIFKKHGFKLVEIKPDFDYKQDIDIFTTSNVLAAVKELLTGILKDRSKIGDHYCYFINSVDMIHSIIKDLDLKDISNIYCSDDSMEKLNDLGYKNVFSTLTELNTFNFFTSRFNSAVDIELLFKPHVTMVTNAYFAAQSMIIPQTEAVQIVGRFRNGVKSVDAVTNTNRLFEYKTTADVRKKIVQQYKTRLKFITMMKEAVDQCTIDFLKNALEHDKFSKYLTKEGKIDRLRIENDLLEQYIMNIYSDEPRLLDAYRASGYFNVKDLDFKSFVFKDNRYFRKSGATKKKRRKEIVAELEKIDRTVFDENVLQIEALQREDPLIVEVYFKKGKEFIEEVNYDEKKLICAAVEIMHKEGKTKLPFMLTILFSFNVGMEYTENEIKTTLKKIYSQFDIEITPVATALDDYFELSPRTTIRKYSKEDKGYRINGCKFNIPDLGQMLNSIPEEEKCPGGFEIS